MRRSPVVGAVSVLLLCLAGSAYVAPGASRLATRGSSLTVYSGNLALVRREVTRVLPVGAHSLRVDGLPTNVDVSSLVVVNAGVTLLGTHSLRSYQDAGSGAGASLELDLEVTHPIETLELAFLTTGLNWSADYSMLIARDDATARIDGYANLVNGSGTTYEDAEVQLLAGTIQRGSGPVIRADEFRAGRAMMEAAPAPELAEAGFGDYHLYTVSTPLTLRSGESRRIRLLGASSVKTRKVYTFSHGADYYRQLSEPLTEPVAVSYEVERPEEGEFGGVPLPAGQVRLLQRDEDGRVQLLGIATIGNTRQGQDLQLSTGYAFDIVGTRTQTDYRRPSNNVHESSWKVELKNASDSDVKVDVIEGIRGDWQILESSHRWEKLSAGAVEFRLEVPAGGEATLEYRVQVRS